MQSSRLEPLRDFTVYAVVFAGGFFGTAVRIFSDSIFSDVAVCSHLISADNAFNPGIFAANIVASSLVAFLSAYIPKRFSRRPRTACLIMRGCSMGFCGGFSSISSLVADALTHESQRFSSFLAYYLLSFAASFVFVWVFAALGSYMANRSADHHANYHASSKHSSLKKDLR